MNGPGPILVSTFSQDDLDNKTKSFTFWTLLISKFLHDCSQIFLLVWNISPIYFDLLGNGVQDEEMGVRRVETFTLVVDGSTGSVVERSGGVK